MVSTDGGKTTSYSFHNILLQVLTWEKRLRDCPGVLSRDFKDEPNAASLIKQFMLEDTSPFESVRRPPMGWGGDSPVSLTASDVSGSGRLSCPVVSLRNGSRASG